MKTLIVLLSVFGFAVSSMPATLWTTGVVAKVEMSVPPPVVTNTVTVIVTNVVIMVETNSPSVTTNEVSTSTGMIPVSKEGMAEGLFASGVGVPDEEILPTDPRSPHYRDSRVETHRVVLVRNSRDEVIGTNYITEVVDYATGQKSYRAVRHLADPSPPPQVVVVQQCCDPQPCCDGGYGSYQSYGGQVFSGGTYGGQAFSGGTYGGQAYSGGVYGGQAYSGGGVYGGQTYGGQAYSGGGVYGGQSRSSHRGSGFGYGSQSYSSSGFSVGGGAILNVYPSNVGYTRENTYSWGGGATIGGSVSSGLNHGGQVSSGSTPSGGGRRH